MSVLKTVRFAPFFILALAAAGCVHPDAGMFSAPRPETVSGTLTYRQRIALSPGSIVHVALVEVRGKAAESVVISEESFPAPGQVPIPFAIAIAPQSIDPARHYAVRARITDAGGRVFWATPRPVPVLTHGHPNMAEVTVAPAGSYRIAPPATYFFECEGLEFTARHDLKGIYLFLPAARCCCKRPLLHRARNTATEKRCSGVKAKKPFWKWMEQPTGSAKTTAGAPCGRTPS